MIQYLHLLVLLLYLVIYPTNQAKVTCRVLWYFGATGSVLGIWIFPDAALPYRLLGLIIYSLPLLLAFPHGPATKYQKRR